LNFSDTVSCINYDSAFEPAQNKGKIHFTMSSKNSTNMSRAYAKTKKANYLAIKKNRLAKVVDDHSESEDDQVVIEQPVKEQPVKEEPVKKEPVKEDSDGYDYSHHYCNHYDNEYHRYPLSAYPSEIRHIIAKTSYIIDPPSCSQVELSECPECGNTKDEILSKGNYFYIYNEVNNKLLRFTELAMSCNYCGNWSTIKPDTRDRSTGPFANFCTCSQYYYDKYEMCASSRWY
jgi:hypothetical protein